ncbi:hypothetical protein HDV00_007389 [Rhizophlyctis rosea]|nr:hypothetical protein HDV00_007389 [Rhizophlyctis rosea]
MLPRYTLLTFITTTILLLLIVTPPATACDLHARHGGLKGNYEGWAVSRDYCDDSYKAQVARCSKTFSKRDLNAHKTMVDHCLEKAKEILKKCTHEAIHRQEYPLLKEQKGKVRRV